MGKYKVIVYAISKNEEKFVKRWVNSMKEADEIYVCDTGSEDNTVNMLKELGVNVKEIHLDKWRFDEARNISLDFVPKDADICVCTDLDEVFDAGWRSLLENAWKKNTTRLKYTYTWNFNPDGTPGVTFFYEKIHRRSGFKWVHPVHEVLEYSGSDEDIYAFEPKIHLKHYPDHEKSRAQYLPLLEMSVSEAPNDDRNMHYLGREYMFRGEWDKCITTLKKHIEMPSSKWADERSASMRYIARAYEAKGDFLAAECWLYRAIAEAPHLREPYYESALLAYKRENYEKVRFMVSETLKITEKPMTYMNDSAAWGYSVYDLGAIGEYYCGAYKKALEYAEKAFSMSPDNERLKNNVILIKNKLK